MALSDQQRAQVRKYLGWEARFHQVTPELEQALDVLGSLPGDEAEVLAELGKCQAVDAAMDKVLVTSMAISTGGVETRAAYQLQVLRSKGTGHAARIANMLGVPLINGGGFCTAGPPPR